MLLWQSVWWREEEKPNALARRAAWLGGKPWLTNKADLGFSSNGYGERKEERVWAEPWRHAPDLWRMV